MKKNEDDGGLWIGRRGNYAAFYRLRSLLLC